ncbi:hypothetical protein IFM89_004783 [Coptis chinensis]|uniref:Uncharacterized protein n=1 Tax=Coptis chinensis TaxID=261450 RepID=A0A835I5L0_9MAGN|nr:hypothetical protein IFM89_004783 [Coptis chinensis]
MADRLETQEEEEEEHWEYRTLNLLQESKLDQKFAAVKLWKSGGTKHTKRWMRRPMAIPELILELQDEKMREYALHCLSKYLLQNWEEERDNYYRTGFLLYNSCCTVTILLKELLVFYQNMVKGNVDGRSSRRVANVLTLLQSIAANSETRTKFITTLVPNFVLPLIQYEYPQVFENVRAVALSVVGILCQARESLIIQWAIKSNMVEICWTSIEAGSELSQVIAMHILEAILQDNEGLSYICSPMCSHLLSKLMITWHHQVEVLARDQDFSPRLLFHIIRCYVLLCNHAR